MHISRTLCLALTLTAPLALLEAAAHPAAAQELTYTLSGVTFADGATASGSFNFDLSTQTFGDYDMTTTNGISDGQLGAPYMPGIGTNSYGTVSQGNYNGSYFSLYANTPYTNVFYDNNITFYTTSIVTGVGTYTLQPGFATLDLQGITYSGEFTSTISGVPTIAARGIAGGSLIVTPAAVPEASTTVSFGLLLALGMGGVVIAAKKKKVAASA